MNHHDGAIGDAIADCSVCVKWKVNDGLFLKPWLVFEKNTFM